MWVTKDNWELASLVGHREEGDGRIWDKSQVSVLGGWWLVTFRKNNRFGDAGFSGDTIPSPFLTPAYFHFWGGLMGFWCNKKKGPWASCCIFVWNSLGTTITFTVCKCAQVRVPDVNRLCPSLTAYEGFRFKELAVQKQPRFCTYIFWKFGEKLKLKTKILKAVGGFQKSGIPDISLFLST